MWVTNMPAWLGRESCFMCQNHRAGAGDEAGVSLCGWCASIVVMEALAGKGANEVLSGARSIPAPRRVAIRRARHLSCDVCGEAKCVALAPSITVCPRCVQRTFALGDDD